MLFFEHFLNRYKTWQRLLWVLISSANENMIQELSRKKLTKLFSYFIEISQLTILNCDNSIKIIDETLKKNFCKALEWNFWLY